MKKNILIMIAILVCIVVILALTINTIKLISNLEETEEEATEDSNVLVDSTNKTDENYENNIVSAIEIDRVRNCIYKYLQLSNTESSAYYGYDDNGNYTKIIDEKDIKEGIYKVLSKSYIEKNSITTDNIYEYIDNINKSILFDIVDMKYYENEQSNQYVVYGIMQDNSNNYIKDAYYIVNINEANRVFSIEPLLNNELSLEEITVEDVQIEKNSENTITTTKMTEEKISKEYFNMYKRLLLGKLEVAYEFLDEQYRQIKFENIDDFKKYISAKREELKGVRLEKYNVEKYDGYTQYTLVDQYDNYYIITEKAFMEFEVMMDNYTIGIQEVVEEYNSSSEKEKAKLNLTKFFTAINNEDYEYAYNRLDETYRSNNFNTQEKFEKYIKETFYENNEIDSQKTTQEGELYIFEVAIVNADNKSESVNKTLIIKVLDGFDYAMSFNIE